MINPIVTVIIPVYNAEEYLASCLESVRNQSFKAFEVILVDDGSIDTSGRICDAYVAKDSRFTVIHKQNEGVSASRNIGIKNSKTEWLLFIDADDELLSNGLEILYRNTSDKIDLVSASYIRFEGGTIVPETNECIDCMYSREGFINAISFYRTRNCERYCWNKLFRYSIINDNSLFFNQDLAYREDVVFLYNYLIHCNNSIKCIKDPVYLYNRRNEGAAMTCLTSYSPKSKGMFFALESCLKIVQGNTSLSDAEHRLKSELKYAYYHLRFLIEKTRDSGLNKEKHDLWRRFKPYLTIKESIVVQLKYLVRPFYSFFKKLLNRND